MAIRYVDNRNKSGVILQLTSLTVEEFEELVPLVQTDFLAHMATWTLEGKPRTGRRYSQYTTCPLPTPEDRLLFVLMYLKGAPLQTAHAAAFDLTQPKANLWLHVLMTALSKTLRTIGVSPSRHLSALAERLTSFIAAETARGEQEVPLASAVETATPPLLPDEQASTAVPAAPFFATTVPSAPFLVPRAKLNSKTTTAVRKNAI